MLGPYSLYGPASSQLMLVYYVMQHYRLATSHYHPEKWRLEAEKTMDDLRVQWMRDRVYAALGLQEESLFRELLQRNESQAQRELLAYLDQPAQQLSSSAILFHVHEVVVEVEEEESERESLANIGCRVVFVGYWCSVSHADALCMCVVCRVTGRGGDRG